MNRTLEQLSPSRANGYAPDALKDTSIRCLLVDDHPAIRVGLRELLAAEPGLVVCDAVSSAEAALAVAERSPVDVAVVDYQLEGRSGLWLSRMLKGLVDPPAVLVYSAFSDYLLGAACVVAQADGMVSKAALGSELCDRVRDVAAGRMCLPVVPPVLAERLRFRLDPSEQAIFGLLSAGIPVPEIGQTLGLAPDELDAMLWSMLSKLERIDPAPVR
ncbi:MAG: response regulator transcription factor [Solirubrobacteraceae bacterium]